ncbi:hypothetical protein Tco_1264393 [Tanacetum coccineum]
MPELEIFHKSETGIFDEASYDEEGVITDFNSLPTEIEVSPTPTLRIHNIHPKSQILGDPKGESAVQTRSKVPQKIRSSALYCLSKAAKKQSQGSDNIMKRFYDFTTLFVDPDHPKKVYKVVKALYGLHQAPRAWDKKGYHAGLHEIVDYSTRFQHIRHALTTNPTIYDSLVKQFWQTATANTLADGTLELQATIDTIVYTITEASIRTKLQLEDASGITILETSEYGSISTIIIHNSSTIYIFTTQSPPPITTPIPASTPTPIPETDPEPMEHTFEEPSPAHQHFSPP